MPEIVPSGRRIVLEHTAGPYVGLRQIMGHTDEFGGKPVPTLTDAFVINPGTRTAVAGLVRATPRFMLFRELPL
jgi:hypothetical protein